MLVINVINRYIYFHHHGKTNHQLPTYIKNNRLLSGAPPLLFSIAGLPNKEHANFLFHMRTFNALHEHQKFVGVP